MKWLLVALLLLQTSCATPYSNKIATGMAVGGVIGAAVGYQFVHHGEHKEFQTQNTIITSVLFALITGGVLAWHYRAIESTEVEISGRYARYRLCDPEQMQPELSRQLEFSTDSNETPYSILPRQIGKDAISLDDNTKWVFPIFRKRYLLPEKGETQVISKRYIWEIIKAGSFVTRSQNPEYFYQIESKGKK